MPVGDLPGWKQVFTDDFNAPVPLGSFPAAVSARWGAYSNTSHDTTGNGRYYSEKVLSVSDGKLWRWSLETGRPLAPPVPLPTDGGVAAFSADGRMLLTALRKSFVTNRPSLIAGRARRSTCTQVVPIAAS